MEKETNLFILNLTLTLRCTLKCKLCVADITKYENRPHFETKLLCETIDRCFQIVNKAERFQLSGGEPLMHEGMVDIVKKAMEYKDKFGNLGFFSNGTMVPGKELLNTIAGYKEPKKFMFYISHYGKYSTKVSEITKLLDEYQIPYAVKVYHGKNQHMDGWVDYGNYERFDYTEAQLIDLFQNCGVCQMGGIWSVRFGEIHRCTRSASGMSLNKIPRMKEDYIDLFDDTVSAAARKDKLLNLMDKKYISACRYCNGDFGTKDSSKRYPAAEQAE